MYKSGKLHLMLVWAVLVICGITASCQDAPTELEQKQTPFATQSGMLVINVTAHRLASPTIDSVTWLDQGRISTMATGDSRLKLLAIDRSELFVFDFETTYMVTGDDTLRNTVLLTIVVPYSDEIYSIRLETPQGSDEVLLAEEVDISTGFDPSPLR